MIETLPFFSAAGLLGRLKFCDRDTTHCEKFWFRLVKVRKKVHGFDILLESFYLPLVNVFRDCRPKKILTVSTSQYLL